MSGAFDIDLETREFEQSLREVMDVSGPKNDKIVITRTAKFVVNRLVARTLQLTNFQAVAHVVVRRVYGKTSLRAVRALMEGRGHPKAVAQYRWVKEMQSMSRMGWAPSHRGVGNAGLPNVKRPDQEQHGTFIDGRRGRNPYVRLINNVSIIEKLDEWRDIVAGALHAQNVAMDKWLQKRYQRDFNRRRKR